MIIEHTTAKEFSKFPLESYHGYTMEDKPEKGQKQRNSLETQKEL